MVSFSCDECQNVFTKPKIERHLQRCRSASVSCIDCLKVFDAQTVGAHKSCITEIAKYGPKSPSPSTNECSQTFCGICSLQLNNAIHALQHYESRKHRAAERKMKGGVRNGEKGTRSKEGEASGGKRENERGANEGTGEMKGTKADLRTDTRGKELGIKKAMKKILKKAPKNRLKRDGLVSALAILLGQSAPENLGDLVDKKAENSARFKIKKGRICLASSD